MEEYIMNDRYRPHQILKHKTLENEHFRVLGICNHDVAIHQISENKLVRFSLDTACEATNLCKLANEQWWCSTLRECKLDMSDETPWWLLAGNALLRAVEERGHIALPEIEEQGVNIFPIPVFRNNRVPILYTQLGFVRKQNRCLSNHTEDGSLLRTIQAVAAGKACVSELERPTEIIVKAEFPDDISSETIEESDFHTIDWRAYCWKTYDVECLFKSTQPAEAVSLGDAGIEEEYLESLADPISCIPSLKDTVEIYQNESGYNGYTLKGQRECEIKERERVLIASKRLEDRKRSPRQSRRANRSPSASQGPRITPVLRYSILQRDGWRCISCGKNSSVTEIEVDHIIPRNLVKNLNIDEKLHAAQENLAAMCTDCNHGKSGRLTKEDINFYLQKFADPTHPNHGILRYLSQIGRLQAL